jgi:hypothetical protein
MKTPSKNIPTKNVYLITAGHSYKRENTTLLWERGASALCPYNQADAHVSKPITGLELARWFQEVKFPRFYENGTGWWQGRQPYAPAAFTPRKYTWYSLLIGV